MNSVGNRKKLSSPFLSLFNITKNIYTRLQNNFTTYAMEKTSGKYPMKWPSSRSSHDLLPRRGIWCHQKHMIHASTKSTCNVLLLVTLALLDSTNYIHLIHPYINFIWISERFKGFWPKFKVTFETL